MFDPSLSFPVAMQSEDPENPVSMWLSCPEPANTFGLAAYAATKSVTGQQLYAIGGRTLRFVF